MGLQSALTTALTGLQAAETTIDVVGNNVANSQTVGFKESSVVFATQFLQTLSIGSAPSTASGGTNPRQLGLGVTVAAITPNISQGTIEISSNPLDLAIQGDGFLIVQDLQGGELFTRNGQLQLNANNELVTTSGNRVIGYGADDSFNIDTSQRIPLRIPLGQGRVAQATSTATVEGVLNPEVAQGETPAIITSAVLGNGAVIKPDSTLVTVGDLSESTPPTLDLNASTNFTVDTLAPGPTAGVYQYRVAFVDGSGEEGAPSAIFTIDTTLAGSGEITLTNLPVPTGQFVSRNVYRTTNGGSTFQLVPLAGTSSTFVDSFDDSALGTALDADTIDPGTYSYYVTFYDPANNVETRPSAEIGDISISEVGRRIRVGLNDLPLPTDGNFTQLRIYRNLAGATEDFYRLATIQIPPDPTNPPFSYIDKLDSATLATNPQLDFDGPRANTGTLLTDVVLRGAPDDLFQLGVLSFSGSKDGSKLESQTFDVTATSTVQNLITFLTDALGIHETSIDPNNPFLPNGVGGKMEINTNGQFVVTSNLGEENALDISLSAFQLQPTGNATTQSLSIPFSETQAANGPGTSTDVKVFDSLGIPIDVRVTTVLEARDGNSTTYRWYANSPNNEPGSTNNTTTVVGDGVLVFDGRGNLLPASPARISIQRNDTASESPLEVTLDFSAVRSLAETNALGVPTSSLSVTSQDGFPPGVLTDFIVTNSGRIQGQFSNGTQRDLGQILMARFANAQGLAQIGDSLFQTGVNSGNPIFGEPGDNGIGIISAGAVELSNTDIGQNLIELILASTQYRGGARVITATQELLDELLALSR